MTSFRNLIAFACLALAVIAPPAMAAPPGTIEHATANPDDQDFAADFAAPAIGLPAAEADALASSRATATYASTTSTGAEAGLSIRLDAPYARLDPGRGFG